MSDRILVTGAAGFVGRHLVDRLVTDGYDVVATDLAAEPPARYEDAVGDQVEYRQGDVTDVAFLDKITDETYDIVFHLAAIVGVEDYVDDPLRIMDVNVIATKRLLERLRGDDTRVVFTSTSEIYGKNPEVPWTESADRVLGPPTINRWSYSISKSACEHMLHAMGDVTTLDATVVRPFNLYGPGQRPDFVVPAFLKEVVNGRVPTVYDDGTQTRCFTYIEDFVEGVVRAATQSAGTNEAFNLGSTREIQIVELAEKVLEIAGMEEQSPEHIDTDELYGDEYEDLQRRVPDTSKAQNLLGWQAQTSLESGLRRTLSWARENY